MKKNGFTLVETLAVIIVLSLFALITVPIIDKNLKESRNVTYDVQIDEVITAAKNWSVDHLNQLPSTVESPKNVLVSELINGGYIESVIKNPKNNTKCIDGTTSVVITLNNVGGGYTYSLNSNDIVWRDCN